MHASTDFVRANIEIAGSRLDLRSDEGIASVIDAGVGHYTLVFAKDFQSRDYTALSTSDERGFSLERLDLERTKSEYPIAVKRGSELTDAGVNVVIYEWDRDWETFAKTSV